MWTEIICLWMGCLVGIAITLGSWIGYDKRKSRKRNDWLEEMDDALNGSDFCEVGCGYHEDCYLRFVDKNIAEDELYHNYCFNCPLRMARDLIEKYE